MNGTAGAGAAGNHLGLARAPGAYDGQVIVPASPSAISGDPFEERDWEILWGGRRAGAPLPVIAANLGHADTRMTERHYAHLAPTYVADVIRATMPSLALIEPPERPKKLQ